MRLYEIQLQATILVESINVVQAKRIATRSVRVIGDRTGWSHVSKRGAIPYRVEIEKGVVKMSNPKLVKP